MNVEPGPLVLHQTLTVPTGYGWVTRCGCGWRAIHDEESAGRASGERHLQTHGDPE